MQTQLSERFNASGSPFDTIENYRPRRSAFDLSRIVDSTIDIGEIKCIECMEVVPGSHHRLTLSYLLKTFPLVVPPMTRYRIRTHFYFCSYESLWKGAETFVTKGRNENVVLDKPSVLSSNYDKLYNDDKSIVNGSYYLNGPNSLMVDMGLQPTRFNGSASVDNYLPWCKSDALSVENRHLPSRFSILQPFAYQKIYRFNYCSPNLLQDLKVWFPNDISAEEWRIDFNAQNVSADGHFVPLGFTLPTSGIQSSFVPRVGVKQQNGTFTNQDNCVNIFQKRYAQFDTDLFNSVKPWIVRGNEPTLETDVTDISAHVLANEDSSLPIQSFHSGRLVSVRSRSDGFFHQLMVNNDNHGVYPSNDVSSNPDILHISPFDLAQRLSVSLNGVAHTTLTANRLRSLIALSVKSEIDALTNGNYNSRIRAQFGDNPRHNEYEPYYLGGTTDVINFGSITQTSQGSSDSPLGTQAGLGSVSSSAKVFNFNVHDFGYIIGVMFISPEQTYNQGIEHQWYDLTQDTVFWPIYSELGFEPLLNKSLYVTGNVSNDDGLFGYTTRYSWMKVRHNRNSGMFSLPPSSDLLFSAYTQSREFSDSPKLSQEFLTMSPNNIRRDFLQFPSLPAFCLQMGFDYTSVLPLPYASTPNRFGF